ncbi:hypothetical protein LX16_1054 [Stackebrandtia albiflava]|uniref:Secreted protein n=1 Tax=Stackebrandtia albiflava TaxID=406432 RepID=A0A562VBU4_9ACTN|nr:hypothetical protein [Stackebrandtia albiflava]TWJ15353.1 hypothetical protein LX16_1054 [Stackebrandtia albiflava]
MTPTQILAIALIAVVVVAILAGGWYLVRSHRLRRRFGPEYDRVVAESPGRLAAERELRERERRHAGLHLRDLTPAERERYEQEWRELQARFVDEPARAVVEADALATRLIAERGYPIENRDAGLAVLSVDHARAVSGYRDAHAVSGKAERGEADTEELRMAVVRYRALVADLLGRRKGGVVHA